MANAPSGRRSFARLPSLLVRAFAVNARSHCSFYSAAVLRSLLAGAGATDADEGGNNLLLIIILIALAVVVVVVVAYFVRRQRAGVVRREVTSAPPPDS